MRAVIAAACASIGRGGRRAVGLGAPPRRLPVSVIPASSPTSPAPGVNGTAAAARALIFASPGDIVSPATPSSPSRGAKPCPQAPQ